MTNKESFITEIKNLIAEGKIVLSNEANAYFADLQKATNPSALITENGIKILNFMRENEQKFNNVFKSKEIGEGLFVSSRSVSGSMRKLCTDGLVEKIGADPVCYSLTDKGRIFEIPTSSDEE